MESDSESAKSLFHQLKVDKDKAKTFRKGKETQFSPIIELILRFSWAKYYQESTRKSIDFTGKLSESFALGVYPFHLNF